MMRPLAEELVQSLETLIRIYRPFGEPGRWREAEGLAQLLEARESSLRQAEPVVRRIRELRLQWEASAPTSEESRRVHEARNRLVALSLDATRKDANIVDRLQSQVERARHDAAQVDRVARASRAYARQGGHI